MEPEQARAVLRDLRWALLSPLLCGKSPPHFAKLQSQAVTVLEELALTPEALPESLWQKRRTPIGRYFESLIAFWLSRSSEVKNLRRNIPIYEDRRTIGELDLLFEVGGRAFHCELAVKLYLGTGACTTASDWLGPLARDRLDRKLERLFGHQLLLPQKTQAKAALHELGIDGVQSYALVKGYLFHPYLRWESNTMQQPAEVASAHARGWWLRLSDADKLTTKTSYRFQALSKADWLGPASGATWIEPRHIAEWLHAYYRDDRRAILLAAIDSEGVERHRGFVVADDWEGQGLAHRACSSS